MYAYNAEPDQNRIDSIDYILSKNYSIYTKNFEIDCECFFKNLYSKNETLTTKQIDDFIKKIIKGKSRSLLSYSSSGRADVLNKLTERHLLTEKQINLLIPCVKTNFKWVDNLILLGYHLSDKQRDSLIISGYRAGVDLILNQNTSNVEELNSICNSAEFNLGNIDTFLKKFNVIPNIKTIDILIQKCGQLRPNNYYYNDTKKRETSDLQSAVIKMIEHKLPVSIDVINKLYKHILLAKISEYVDVLFKDGHITKMDDISFMFDKTAHASPSINNIRYILTKCEQYKIEFDHKYLKQLMIFINYTSKSTSEQTESKFDIKIYKHGVYLYDSQLVIEPYYDIINCFIKFNNSAELELLENACLVSDRLMFDILIRKLNKFTDKCVYNTCASGSIDMLKILFNMKALPTIECLESLQNSSTSIFNMLLQNGLPINIQTIDIAFEKHLYIPNLEDYFCQFLLPFKGLYAKTPSLTPMQIERRLS